MNTSSNRFPYINNPLGFKLPEKAPITHPIITEFEQFSTEEKTLLLSFKDIIVSVLGDVKVCVFGSRIKGNWTEKSDWDLSVYYTDITKEKALQIQNLLPKNIVDVKYSISTEKTIGIEIKN